MAATKKELEQKLQKMATLIDGTISRASSLLDAAANDPEKLEKQLQQLGRESTGFIKKQKLEWELRILKLRLLDVERRITLELEKKRKENTRH